MSKSKIKRIKINNLCNDGYYKLYKFLFFSEYKGLSNDAKVLYGMLSSLLPFSIENEWVDEKGDVFLKMSNKKICILFECDIKKATKLKKELVEYGLIDVVSVKGSSDKLYLKNYDFKKESR